MLPAWVVRIAAATVLAVVVGVPQAARQAAADSLANALLWGMQMGVDPGAFPQPLRSEVEGYLKRSAAYRTTRTRPADSAEMEMVYQAWVNYERLLAGISADASARALAVAYVDDLRPCYEWEGLHECPEREAMFAEKYLAAHPGAPFSRYLPLLAAHRWLCTAEAYAREKQPEAAARTRQAFERQIGVAIKADTLLIRVAADALMARKQCFSGQ
jgi:hypothetical protein